jgi:hypothetical protein
LKEDGMVLSLNLCPPVIQRTARVEGLETNSFGRLEMTGSLTECSTTSTSFQRATLIGEFPGEPYVTHRPISVCLDWIGTGFMASWTAANIASTGESAQQAVESLAAEILDTYELYAAEPDNLGPEAARQFALLKQYIGGR